MQESQVVGDLLLPADQQSTCAIGPGVGAFDNPAVDFSTWVATRRGVVVLLGNMRDVAASTRRAADRLGIVPFVGTEMLLLASGRLGAADGNAAEGLGHQGVIMRIGATDRGTDRHAPTFGQ